MAARQQRETTAANTGSFKWISISLAFGAFLFVSPAMAALTVVGLAPTLAAWLVDQHVYRPLRLRTIFLFNVSGIVPYLVTIWNSGKGFSSAIGIMSDIYSWLIMYGAAALGLAALWIGPQLASTARQMMASDRARRLGKIRRQMIKEWSGEIAGEIEDKNLPDLNEGEKKEVKVQQV